MPDQTYIPLFEAETKKTTFLHKQGLSQNKFTGKSG